MPGGGKKKRCLPDKRSQKAKAGPLQDNGTHTRSTSRDYPLGAWREFAQATNGPFSLQQEARHFEQKHFDASSTTKFGKSRVKFLSAGASGVEDATRLLTSPRSNVTKPDVHGLLRRDSCEKAPLQPAATLEGESRGAEEATKEGAKDTEDSGIWDKLSQIQITSDPQSSRVEDRGRMLSSVVLESSGSTARALNELPVGSGTKSLFFEDSHGFSDPIHTGIPPPKMRRTPSPASSQLSEEEIVFRGRKNMAKTPRLRALEQKDPSSHIGTSPSGATYSVNTIEDPIRISDRSARLTKDVVPTIPRRPESILSARGMKKNRACNANKDATLRDYISNLQANGEDLAGVEGFLASQDLGGLGNRYHGDEAFERADVVDGDWDSAYIADFENISTSEEEIKAVEKILSRRDRPSGCQYLVIRVGGLVDDAKWLPQNSLTESAVTADLIRAFEDASEVLINDCDKYTNDDSLTDEAQIEVDVQEAIEDMEDEQDLEHRRRALMTDEQIARLLSKQEELGLGSSSLVLYDGTDEVPLGETSPPLYHLSDPLRNTKTTAKGKGKGRMADLEYYAATFAQPADANLHDDFSIREHGRLRTNKRSNGPFAKTSFDLSDSELERGLEVAWENDRSRKKVRKQQREELRAQGLLGRKRGSPPDLKIKYPKGITIDQIKTEIELFLDSSMDSLSLPPMDASARKIVHEASHKLALKTKSIGSGNTRFPILYKTHKTGVYDERAFAFVRRRFMPRIGQGRMKRAHLPSPRSGAGPGIAYHDGEVVGASAPELSTENKGRAMMEKMGWSTGTGLGASNNKGINVPVAQIVKTTRAGLG